ncbi:serine/arginine-rich protein specific kinase [Dorcoceras hygrometricum]|uniref:Serine/arginine-rich protein specific kinase n=1 Tax=Dorcoceras hygrometricum TaxID=472368 RepID=A0A2Z7B1B7_9LAMI|nr:serine/arginine-rich protein specific kinase [Dorcoceras hygrometricum]
MTKLVELVAPSSEFWVTVPELVLCYWLTVSDLVARDFICGNYSSELRMLELEDERFTPVYLISLLGSVSHYERSYHGFSAGRGADPAGCATGGG